MPFVVEQLPQENVASPREILKSYLRLRANLPTREPIVRFHSKHIFAGKGELEYVVAGGRLRGSSSLG